MQLATSREAAAGARALTLELATASADIEAAQRLRYLVFADELGACVSGRRPGRDEDIFDPWCEHLIVRDTHSDEIVATCRIVTADRARRIGTFCSEGHFDLTRLLAVKPRTAEVSRACIRADYRSRTTAMLLWQGVARLMRERELSYLIGCASISMRDGGANAVRVYRDLAQQHLAPIEYRVRPRHVLIGGDDESGPHDGPPADVPPLLRGYLRMGAWIAGEPSWDPDFNTADLLLFTPLSRVCAPYARHLWRRAA